MFTKAEGPKENPEAKEVRESFKELTAEGGKEISGLHAKKGALDDKMDEFKKKNPEFNTAEKLAERALDGEDSDKLFDALVFRLNPNKDGLVEGKKPTGEEIARMEQTLDGFDKKLAAEAPKGEKLDLGAVYLAAYLQLLGGRLDDRNAEVSGIESVKNKKEGEAMVAQAMDALDEYAESHRIGHGGKNPEDEPAVAGATAKEVIGQIEGGAAAPKTDPNAQAKLAALSAEEKAGAKINAAKSHAGPTEMAETPRTAA